jgi:hypothetical protein
MSLSESFYSNNLNSPAELLESRVKRYDGVVMNAADVIGICRGTTVRVVGYVDVNRIPKTQAELVQLVKGVETLAKK